MNEKILIINDDSSLIAFFTEILSEKGFEVESALNGPKGIAKAMDFHPDLVLLDIMMPEMNGYEVCHKLKEIAETKEIPIIFLSSLIALKDKIKGLELGAVDFVSLGDQGELLARIAIHLKIRALTKALMETNQKLTERQLHIDNDLKAAAVIQRSLLPKDDFKLPYLNMSWRCMLCHTVGGDSFNVVPLNDESAFIYMIDVSGHGVPASMVAVVVSQFLRQSRTERFITSPKEVLSALAREYPIERFDKFFTIFYGVINAKTSQLCYSNGGHPPAILLQEGRPYEILDCGGPLIGMGPNSFYEDKTIALRPGSKLILYTDGITECQNSRQELFGFSHLYELLEQNKSLSIGNLASTVISSLEEFAQNVPYQDDISIFSLEMV